MKDFIGVHECKIDDKGRVIIPAPLKRQLMPYAEQGFVVKYSPSDPCLELYTTVEWAKQEKMIRKLNLFVPQNKKFVRIFYAGVKQVDLDTTGRILLAKDLIAYSGISKDVIMASSGSFIEIWDKEKYEAAINDPNIDFGKLAEEVMGNIQVIED